MRPLTLTRPKPIVPILNRPFLAYQLALLAQHSITDVVLACSYRVQDVRTALSDAANFGVRLRYAVERTPLGTGGGVRNAADLAARAICVLNGDVLTDVDLGAMRRFHEARSSRTTIFLAPVPDPRPYGLVETDTTGRILRFREKPSATEAIATNTINAGVYLIDAELIRRIPADRSVSIEREFFPRLIAEGVPCFGFCPPAYWRDIGSPAAYRAAHIELLEGKMRSLLSPPGDLRHGNWISAESPSALGARVESPSVVGAGVEFQPGCHIGPFAVIGDGVQIGRRARVEGAILWERVEVGSDAILRQCLIGAHVRIGAHAQIGPDVVLESGAVIPEHAKLGT